MSFIIKQINSDDTLTIRHQVMWPNKSIDYVKLSEDKNGNHYGLFLNKKLISVISFFDKNKEIQFRKFATINNYQGKGYGTILLKYVIDLVETEGYNKIWCNARVDKIGYYKKMGLKETASSFKKGGLSFIIMEKYFLINTKK